MCKVIMSQLASKQTKDYFVSKGFEVIEFKGSKQTYDAVDDHPDMYLFFDDTLFAEASVELECSLLKGEAIGSKYPDNIKYNVVKVGRHVIGKFAHTAEVLKSHFNTKNYELIDVNQGYSKCSTAVVDDHSIITSDKHIKKQALKFGIDVLLIDPGHIVLEGLDHGFIGGAVVSFDNIVFFNGDVSKHPNYKAIKIFVENRHKKLEWIDEPLTDIGSFILLQKEEDYDNR